MAHLRAPAVGREAQSRLGLVGRTTTASPAPAITEHGPPSSLTHTPTLGTLQRELSDGSDAEVDVWNQRAKAYAALTGLAPPSSSQPSVFDQSRQNSPASGGNDPHDLLPSPLSSHIAVSSRAGNTSRSVSPVPNMRRSRAYSVGPTPTGCGTGAGDHPPSDPHGSGPRRKRRSLSQKNSIVATRIAKAFVVRELGEGVFAEHQAKVSRQACSIQQYEQRELWFSLCDGVIFLRLLEHLVPTHTDAPAGSSADVPCDTIERSLSIVKQAYGFTTHELFEPHHLLSGTLEGFERVLHTFCVLAEATVARRQGSPYLPHGPFGAARSAESLLPSPTIDDALPSPSPVGQVSNATPEGRGLGSVPQRPPLRPSRLVSNSGTKYRLRAPSRPDSGSLAQSPVERARPALSPIVNPQVPTHLVYSRQSDKRMSESAVEIMGMLREQDERPRGRRAASERPHSAQVGQSGATSSQGASLGQTVLQAIPSGESHFIHHSQDEHSMDVTLPHSGSYMPEGSESQRDGSLPGSPTELRRASSQTDDVPFPRSRDVSPLPVDLYDDQRKDDAYSGGRLQKNAANPSTAGEARRPLQRRWNSEARQELPLYLGAGQMRSRHNSTLLQEPLSPRRRGYKRRSADPTEVAEWHRAQLKVTETDGAETTYHLGECVGRGQFGSVFRALNMKTGAIAAVKRIRLADKSEAECVQLQNEVTLLKSLRHPSVVKYEGLVRTSRHMNIVMEFVENGSLHATLNTFGVLPENLIAGYVVKILEGLHYLHSVRVIHRDLKAANILTTKNGNIKLSDFGVSLQLNAVHNTLHNAEATGTPNWMAPEVIKLEAPSFASDIWSLACTIIELFTGRPPYSNLLAMTAMFKIVEEDMPPLPAGASENMLDFLRACFCKNPRDRPTAIELFGHPWLRSQFDASKPRPQDSIPFLSRINAHQPLPTAGALATDNPTDIDHDLPELDRSASSPEHVSELDHEAVSPMPASNFSDSGIFVNEGAGSSPHGSPEMLQSARVIDLSQHAKLSRRTESGLGLPQDQLSPSSGLAMPRNFQHYDCYESWQPQEHYFVKTSFSKPLECRICQKAAKKNGALCTECGLICHSSCKSQAPEVCDIRFQFANARARSRRVSMSPGLVSDDDRPDMLCLSQSVPAGSPLTMAQERSFGARLGFGNQGRKASKKQSAASPVHPSAEAVKGVAETLMAQISPATPPSQVGSSPPSTIPDEAGSRSRDRSSSLSSSTGLPVQKVYSINQAAAQCHPQELEDDEAQHYVQVERKLGLPGGGLLRNARRSFSGVKAKSDAPAQPRRSKRESTGECVVQ